MSGKENQISCLEFITDEGEPECWSYEDGCNYINVPITVWERAQAAARTAGMFG